MELDSLSLHDEGLLTPNNLDLLKSLESQLLPDVKNTPVRPIMGWMPSIFRTLSHFRFHLLKTLGWFSSTTKFGGYIFGLFLLSVSNESIAHFRSCYDIYNPHPLLPLIAMQPKYRGENEGKYIDPSTQAAWRVRYYREQERWVFENKIVDGKLKNAQHEWLNSPQDAWGDFHPMIFVLGANEKIYSLLHEKRGLRHHSSLMAGGPVRFAGTLTVVEGKIIEIDSASGHYKPNKQQTLSFIYWLLKQGADLRGTRLVGKMAFELTGQYSILVSELMKQYPMPNTP